MTLKTALIIGGDASGAQEAVDGLTGDLAKLNQATGQASAAAASHTRSLGQQRAGMYQLGQQVQDVGVQLSMGTGIMQVMAMQGGQLATAIDMIGLKGAGGRAAAFFAGPWGTAILAAGAILSPFVAKLWESDEASDKSRKSGMALVDALTGVKAGTDAARQALRDYNEEQEKARQKTIAVTQAMIDQVGVDIARSINERRKIANALKDKIDAGPAPGDEGAISWFATGGALTAQLKEQQNKINELQQTWRDLNIQFAKDTADPINAIKNRYRAMASAAENAAAKNDRLAASLRATLQGYRAAEAADIAAYRKAHPTERASRPERVSIGTQIQREQAGGLLNIAQRYTGLSERVAGDRDQLKALFAQANMRIDPQMVAWCAAFVNSVLAAGGLKGTGSLSARSFLGYGEATNAPTKGDIVVSKRGPDPSKGHVGFYQGTDAQGRVLVLGGNTGNKVGTQAIDRSQVLGFRRAPSAADGFAEEQKAAAAALKDYARDLDQVTARYLPAVAAAKDYADELARINKLAAGYDPKKEGSGLSPEQAAAARAALDKAHQARLREINLTPEAKAAADAAKSIDGVIESLTREIAVRQALNPVQAAMIGHQAELAKLSGEERAKREALLQTKYAELEATRSIEEATRRAADAQAEFQRMAVDAFTAVALGGEKAGKVISRLVDTIAQAAIEAALLGTGPLADLLRGGAGGGGAGKSVASAVSGQRGIDAVGKSVEKGLTTGLDRIFGKGGGAKALQYGGFGAAASGLTGGSKLGGMLGGMAGGQIATSLLGNALGSFAGPLGSVVGGVLVGALGGLFKKTKSGSATIGDTVTAATLSGNSSAARKEASGLAGNVQDIIGDIAKRLGGSVGSYAPVTIGKYGESYKVNTTGASTLKKGKAGVVDFDEDQNAAAMFAAQTAIARGAVTGLSAAVAQALRSSSDVNKAVEEALKVQDVEVLLGGMQAEVDKAFRSFEATAKERVRIARQYGFDVRAIEKRNAEDRAKIAADLAKTQVGSLQALIDEMTRGSLFAGTALERIDALNTAIAKARTDVDAGLEGAGDTLAKLLQDRLGALEDAYGTTGGYAAGRSDTLEQARSAVAAANARIAAAQTKSDPALTTTNNTLDEISDQSAELLAAMNRNNTLMEQLVAGITGGGGGGFGGGGFNLQNMAAV